MIDSKIQPRQSKIQFYYYQTEERKRRLHFKLKSQKLFNAQILSSRLSLISRPLTTSIKLGSVSCCCEDCGKQSSFRQRVFQLYPFEQTQQSKIEKEKDEYFRNFYKNSKYIRKLRRSAICVLFIIRYKIVQNIRKRQRQRMKKAFNTRIQQPRMTFLNVLDIAKKNYQLNQKFKSVSHFELKSNTSSIQSPNDSDEEYYHFKPRKSLIQDANNQPCYSHSQPKLNKYQQKLYCFTSPNKMINDYINKKMINKTQQRESHLILPQIQLSQTTTPRKYFSQHNNLIQIRSSPKPFQFVNQYILNK